MLSANLYSGSTTPFPTLARSSFVVTFNNPGKGTYISSLVLSLARNSGNGVPGANFTQSNSTTTTTTSSQSGEEITNWQVGGNSTTAINFAQHSGGNDLPGGETITSFSYYPMTTNPSNITAGQLWQFDVNFTNGQSIWGFAIAES